MRDRPTTSVVLIFHLTRPVVLVALMGIVAMVLALLAPALAQAGDGQGGGVDAAAKPWICHPAGGGGETGSGWNLIDPDRASAHFDRLDRPKHRVEGRVDTYAGWSGARWTCPGAPTGPTTTSTTTPTTTSTVTTPTTTKPTAPPTRPTTTEAPETAATEPPATSTSPTAPPAPPEEAATLGPPTGVRAAPEVAAPVEENAVPAAQTDGAELVGAGSGPVWSLQPALLGAGLLLLAASGLLWVRRHGAQE